MPFLDFFFFFYNLAILLSIFSLFGIRNYLNLGSEIVWHGILVDKAVFAASCHFARKKMWISDDYFCKSSNFLGS